jgi:hypothetical protein
MPPPLLELLPRRPLLMLAPEEDKEDDDPRILSEAAVGEEPVRSSVRPRAGFPTPDICELRGHDLGRMRRSREPVPCVRLTQPGETGPQAVAIEEGQAWSGGRCVCSRGENVNAQFYHTAVFSFAARA